MHEISETLNIGGQVVNVHVEIADKTEPEPIPAPVAVEPQREPRKEEPKLSQKFTTPAAQPITPAKPTSDAAANGTVPGTPSFKDWIGQDQAYKQSIPQSISDGGKGVSN
jgi:hypothetical protein